MVTGFGGFPAIYNATTGVAVAPDLFSVYCVTKAMCFASGGYASPVLSVPTLPWSSSANTGAGQAASRLGRRNTLGVRRMCCCTF
jgi:hypothetical protein